MRGRNLGTLWDLFGGAYLTNRHTVTKVLGIGHQTADRLLTGVEILTIGTGTYYRTLDVIDIIENNFRKGT